MSFPLTDVTSRRLLLLSTLVLCVGCGPPAPVAIPQASQLTKLGPGVHKQTAQVPGVGNLKYAIEIPAGYDGTTPVPLVLLLHYGYDGATPDPYTGGDMIEAFRPGLRKLGAIVVAPDALGGDWTSSRNEQAAIWLTKSVMNSYAIDPKKVVITGFSMGGAGTWFIGSRHQNLFTAAIPVAAPVAGGNDWKIPVYVIHSDKDAVVSYSGAKSHADAVKGKGTKLHFHTVHGIDHYNTGSYGGYVGDGVKWLQGEWQ
jgi:predicted peptidase